MRRVQRTPQERPAPTAGTRIVRRRAKEGAGAMGDHKEKQPVRVGAAVRRRRRALELTLAVVAERSGLSVPFLSQIENDRARPSTSSLEKVADALRTTAVELLAAADPACSVDLVRCETTEQDFTPRVRT